MVSGVVLFHKLSETSEILAASGGAWMATLDGLAADPHQQHADQRVHHHVSCRLLIGVFGLQAGELAVEVVTVFTASCWKPSAC
jgi:hypothetical protein